jgi:magnesium chelatase family protein
VLATVSSATILGVEGRPVTVEVHVAAGLPAFTVVGLPDASCREAHARVRAAIQSSHLEWPTRKVTVNLAPSSERKIGTGLDLAIALGVLAATEQIPRTALAGLSCIGELGLDASIRPVAGVVSLVDALPGGVVVVPAAAARQARLVDRHEVRPVDRLPELVLALRGEAPWPTPDEPPPPPPDPPPPDLSEVRGQAVARQALEVAAAGGHHLLLVGSPGAGKTMLARRLPGLLPPLGPDEALAVTRVMSAAGIEIPGGGLVTQRPFRAPHHSSSLVSLIGGGAAAMRPGEVSLASHGVLFLDEMGEFPASVVDALRQPLEEGVVRVARARASITLPAGFLLVAATNPCPCGGATEPAGCRCTETDRKRYRRRLSGPVLDRFDLRVTVHRPDPAALLGVDRGESSAAVAERVVAARALAARRGVASNAAIPSARLDELTPLDARASRIIEVALRRGRLTARGLDRVRRVARTVADLAALGADADPDAPLAPEAVALALALRGDIAADEVVAA